MFYIDSEKNDEHEIGKSILRLIKSKGQRQMKLNKFIWNNYKQTEHGKNIINIFKKFSIQEILELDIPARTYTPYEEFESCVEMFFKQEKISFPENMNKEEAKVLLGAIFEYGVMELVEDGTNNKILENNIKQRIETNKDDNSENEEYYEEDDDNSFLVSPERGTYEELPFISYSLYTKYPNYFFPYFFVTKFSLLKQIFDSFQIEIPPIPKRNDYLERLFYYLDLCEVLNKFKAENEFTHEELGAFLYDFAPSFLEEINKGNSTELPSPSNIWLIGGNMGADEDFNDYKEDEYGFWQSNRSTKRGDLLIFYCLSPVSSFHSIWRAKEDGGIDPFFFYYTYSSITKPVKIPLFSIKEMKQNEYFKKLGIVRGSFQGVNGVSFTFQDYSELLKVLDQKGFNTLLLPDLINPNFIKNKELKNERDVETNLLEPFLEKINLLHRSKRQLTVKMGVGERNYPDYAIDVSGEERFEIASLIIEAKYFIKTPVEFEKHFEQAHSYAIRLRAKIIVLCDKDQIYIFKSMSDSFSRDRYEKFYWVELENQDSLHKIKKMLEL